VHSHRYFGACLPLSVPVPRRLQFCRTSSAPICQALLEGRAIGDVWILPGVFYGGTTLRVYDPAITFNRRFRRTMALNPSAYRASARR
jgi:hypothetical protein